MVDIIDTIKFNETSSMMGEYFDSNFNAFIESGSSHFTDINAHADAGDI